VVTIGGIYGVVANVKPGEDEVVLKIDEDKDVKVRVSRSSIAQVLVPKDKEKED
jgi:preprotein translocase subunit YajC